MARRSNIYHPEPKSWFNCPIRGCYRKFRTQAGRTKHISAKHDLKKDELELQSRIHSSSLSDSLRNPPPSNVSSFDTSLLIDLDYQQYDTMPDVLHTPYHDVQLASNLTQSPNSSLSPMPFNPSPPPRCQPEVEIRLDQPEHVITSSTNYHPSINGMN
jgi:hypothetical protein